MILWCLLLSVVNFGRRRVVHAVTAYGRRAREPGVGGADGTMSRAERAPWRSTLFLFIETYFDRLKLKNVELKFKCAKYESCRPINHL
jgi:hypothetical protein